MTLRNARSNDEDRVLLCQMVGDYLFMKSSALCRQLLLLFNDVLTTTCATHRQALK